ncbi:hypothetical protein AB0H42_35270 [Nocardia sp. NPDC050799]|uniref:hypothetical protein n=1 Tax=Nocardia sp. NPDC050799 TaxID=3154842 RepID=UPI00340BEB01
MERLQTSARELGPALADRFEHAATHTRGALATVAEGEQAGLQAIARPESSAEQAGTGVPIYGRTIAGEWKTIDPDRVVRARAFNSAGEVVGVIYPDHVAYLHSRWDWINRGPDETLRTLQVYQVEPSTEHDAHVFFSFDRPEEPRPFGDDPNTISLHGMGGHTFAVGIDPSLDKPYGEQVLLGPKSAGRLVATDPIYTEEVAPMRKDREVVVDSCSAGADENAARDFADQLFTTGTADGTLYFPTDDILAGRGTLPDGSKVPYCSVVANYDEYRNPLPLWRSITKDDTPEALPEP